MKNRSDELILLLEIDDCILTCSTPNYLFFFKLDLDLRDVCH